MLSKSRKRGIYYWIGWSHKAGQIVLTDYEWSQKDQESFLRDQSLPCQLFALPPATPCIIIRVSAWYSRPQEWVSHGGYDKALVGLPMNVHHVFLTPIFEKPQVTVEACPFIVPSEAIPDFMPASNSKTVFLDPFGLAFHHCRVKIPDLHHAFLRTFMIRDKESWISEEHTDLQFQPALYVYSVKEVLESLVEVFVENV